MGYMGVFVNCGVLYVGSDEMIIIEEERGGRRF